jgi:hypothetical protein
VRHVYLAALLMAGCAPTPPPLEARATQAANPGHLVMLPFRMEDQKQRPLTMDADGVVTGPQGIWGRVSADGKVTYADGRPRGQLTADGRLLDAKGAPLATIAADGSAKLLSFELRFGPDGAVVGGLEGSAIRLTTRDPTVNRVAMLVFLMTQVRP